MADAEAAPKPRRTRKAAEPTGALGITCTWAAVCDAARAHAGLVSRVFHPEPQGELVELRDGINAGVAVGEPGYQLSSGELVRL